MAWQVRSSASRMLLGDRAGDQQHIGMPRRGDEAQAEALQVVERVVERVDFQLAAVAGAGVHLADRQASARAARVPRG